MHAIMNMLVPASLGVLPTTRKNESTISVIQSVKRTLSDLEFVPSSRPNKPRPCKRQKPRTVCFAEAQNTVHMIEPTEADDCWLQDDDYDAIRNGTKETLKQIIILRGRVSMIDQDRFCARGLEGQIAKLFGNNNYHMTGKFQTVLLRKQATDMKKNGFVDPIGLSQMSARLSTHDRTRAARLAQFDAKLS